MKSKKLTSFFLLLSGVLYFLAAFKGKNFVYIPIGCCFVVLAITKSDKDDNIEK